MAQASRRWLWIAALLVAVFLGSRYLSKPLDLAEAIGTRQVDASTIVEPDQGHVMIRLTRGSSASGTVRGAIAAGTILFAGEGTSQRLMTATPLSFVLSSTSPSADSVVKTFCLDQLAAVPAAGTHLSFAAGPDDRGMTTEETEPLHRLATCLSSSSLSDPDQQATVWAVRENLLDKSAADIVQFWTKGLEETISKQQRAKLDARRLRMADNPAYNLLSPGDFDQMVEAEFQSERDAIHQEAERRARAQLAGLQRARQTLGTCGYGVAALRAFE